MDLVIKNGVIINPDSTIKADIGIEDGIVKVIGNLSGEKSEEVLDAEGKYVFPGIIDVHTHINHVGGDEKTKDDFFTGTRSAAFGGVTTIIDFAMQKKNETVMEAIERRREEADSKVCIDYGLHANITNLDRESLIALPKIIGDGYPSFKLFMTFQKAGFMVEDSLLYQIMKIVYESGGIVGIHAENDAICEYLTEKYVGEEFISAEYHAKSRPNIAETECISRATLFAQDTDSALYIFHLTTKEGAAVVREAKRKGVRVYAETCPHYLTLSEKEYLKKDAYKYIMTPPLRSQQDIDALWKAVQDNTISLVSSDHCCYDTAQKRIRKGQSFRDITPGIPGTETLLPIVHHFGVNTGKLTLNKMVAQLCQNPAKIFGLHPKKGSIIPGADADLVIFDPDMSVTLKDTKVHMATDYTPYDNFRVKGYPVKTISRGKVIVSDGVFSGEAGDGRFIKRTKPVLI